jgi:hypothetical protein
MSQFTSFRLTASTVDAYTSLVCFVANIKFNSVINPSTLSATIFVNKDWTDTLDSIDEWVKAQEDVECNVTVGVPDAAADIFSQSEELATIKAIAEKEKAEKDQYQKYWMQSLEKDNRIKAQVDAIAVLIGNIYPK